jgi:hypothetical protein
MTTSKENVLGVYPLAYYKKERDRHLIVNKEDEHIITIRFYGGEEAAWDQAWTIVSHRIQNQLEQ